MLELTIGSRFYYQNQLYEVKEGSCSDNCVFKGTQKCSKLKCDSTDRHDKKDVYFSKVDEKNDLSEDLLPDNQPIKYDGTDYLTNKIDFIRNVHSWNPVSYTSYSLEWNYFPNYKEIEVNNSYNFMSNLNKENSNIMTLTLTDEAETICLDYDRYWAQTYISKYNTPPTEQIGFYNKALDIIKVDLLKQLDLFAKLYSLR